MKLYLSKFKNIDDNLKQNIYQLLHSDRQQRADAFTEEVKRDKYLYAEMLCMYLIKKNYGIKNSRLKGKVGTKPYLEEDHGVFLSRSYSNDYVFVGLDQNNSIGVDIEDKIEYNASVEKYFYTDDEKVFIENSGYSEEAFSMIWTLKESFIKCIGEGLTFPLTTINVKPTCTIDKASLKPMINPCIKVKDHFLNSYMYTDLNMAVCSDDNIKFPDVELIDIDLNKFLKKEYFNGTENSP